MGTFEEEDFEMSNIDSGHLKTILIFCPQRGSCTIGRFGTFLLW